MDSCLVYMIFYYWALFGNVLFLKLCVYYFNYIDMCSWKQIYINFIAVYFLKHHRRVCLLRCQLLECGGLTLIIVAIAELNRVTTAIIVGLHFREFSLAELRVFHYPIVVFGISQFPSNSVLNIIVLCSRKYS